MGDSCIYLSALQGPPTTQIQLWMRRQLPILFKSHRNTNSSQIPPLKMIPLTLFHVTLSSTGLFLRDAISVGNVRLVVL